MSKTTILDDYLELVTYGFTNPMPDADDGPWKITAKDVVGGEINFNTARKTTQLAYNTKLTKKSRPKIGDVLLTKDGTLGRLAIVKQADICINQSVAVLRPNEKILPEYLYYLLSTPEYQRQMIGDSDGTVIKHIYITRVGKMEVNIPSIDEQKERLKVLLASDGKIKLNRQTNQTLEQIAQAIFKSWFVDFEPTRAKVIAKQKGGDIKTQSLAAQAILCGAVTLADLEQMTEEHLPLSSQLLALIHAKLDAQTSEELGDNWLPEHLAATADLFPNALIDSELGEIPDGWEYSEIGNEVTVVGGGTPSTKNAEFWDGGDINWTSPKDMSNLTDKILLKTDRKITKAGLAKISSGLLPKNTVLMSSRAPVGYLALSKIPVAINQGYIAMKCEGELSPEYVLQWTNSVMDEIKQRASGTTFAEISKKNFKIIPVIVPSKNIMEEFSSITASLYKKITELLEETHSLTELRDTLLPKLLSGEISLKG